MRRALWTMLVLGAAATPAAAQSKRYPVDAVDKDDEEAKKSVLWESATNPQRTPYDALIAEAKQALDDRTPEGAKDAIGKLDEAVKLVPQDAQAYRLRGDAHMLLKDWARCAADLQATLERLKRTDVEVRSTADLRRRLGVCLARANKLAEAERVLADAAASGSGNGEVWMRLGEVRIALGKLEEAITALEQAKEHGDVPPALVRWLLAGAYDRARRPAEAAEASREASGKDHDLVSLRSAGIPLLGVGEAEYLMGLAYSLHDPPRPEHALLYFRRFLKVAPESPWRKRADDHLRELRRAELPEFVEKSGGSAVFEPTDARGVVRRFMPQLRACAAKVPAVVFKVEVIKTGPRSTPPVGGRRTYVPPEGVPILVNLNLEDAPKADIDSAVRCMEPIGDKLKASMPAIKDKDSYYRAVFYVVAP